ncbi:uncharacterized protein BDW43DRAFT_314786 [Aspergillus alliaceus]|uniref:uncharacterized protein n=1 Tax=Petromyces alliaceus TaxID=209559 RepID=UPI0012A4F45F|nr:uncharacterized protein BDW43DRAFT_314786 [Aspergillus alliaceus]KAB8229586.1 hypothetical protein BDW43DRAFT_314786 [Aspergillus alliaceus]
MPRDADFLSPRDLLVDDHFCLTLTSFRKLANIIKSTENLPRDDESLRQKTGFWESGYQILYIYLNPIAQQFLTVQQVALGLNEAYNYTGTICDNALTLCASAPDDYDKIFTDIEALRQDPDNVTLRDRVQKEVQDRLYWVQILRDGATGWSDDLRSYTLQAEDCEAAVQTLAAPFQGSALRDRLTSEDDQGSLQDDLDALGNVQSLLEGFSMVEDMSASLQEVEKMAGSATLIADDIQNLVDYIQKHADPDDNPLGGLVERKLLDKWATLQTHVTDFKNAYLN